MAREDQIKTLKEWIAALRSNKYKQTQNTLRDDRGFCCLSVLCDMNPNGKWNDDFNYEIDINGHIETLDTEIFPGTFAEWTGLLPMDISYSKSGQTIQDAVSYCVSMNDNQDLSFTEIADQLEHHAIQQGLF